MVLLSLWSSFVFAVVGIPTKYMNDPAIDLVRSGHELMPDEVHALYESNKGRFDISTLNPSESSDLWKNTFPKQLPEDEIAINDMDEVDYDSPIATTSGVFRFNIQNNSGDQKKYDILIDKSVHSVLLAKSLLRKIGYSIPPVKYLPHVIIRFKSELEKKTFISYMNNVAKVGNTKNWIIEELEDHKLLLQDVVVMNSNNANYNLAINIISPKNIAEMIQGRRLLSSLVVPLTIVNLTESVNMLRWHAGVELNNQILLNNNTAEEYQCTWDDARWISRRIEKLSRADWEEIVSSSHVPKAVQMILVEKIISRRNSVMKLFKIDHKELKIDSQISNGVDLYKGKLTKQSWDGYASRFAFGDPDSPLSDSEIQSWVTSKTISVALDLAVSGINAIPYIKWEADVTDSTKFQSVLDQAAKKSVEFGAPSTVAVKGWVMPTVGGNLILSRNIVTGTYLGTDSLVQLADTVGVTVGAGISASVGLSIDSLLTGGALGIFSGITNMTGITSVATGRLSGEVNLVRSYTHLRPVTNIQKSLKYPFKNMFVPLVKLNYGKKLHEATILTLDPTASEKLKAEKIEEALKPFKDAMEVGESLLVTDSVGVLGGAELGAGHRLIVKASLGLLPGHVVVSRFHVHRKSAHEFQIYKDLAHNGSIGVGFELNSLIPLVKLSYKKSGGHARVKFYSLNLHPENPKVLENAAQLRKAIVFSSTSEMDEVENTKPYTLLHSFTESNPKAGFLFWQWQHINSSTSMTLIHPQGEERYYRRQYYGSSKGKNYQSYVASMITNWISMIFEQNININDGSGSNAGYSFKGTSQTRFGTFDEEVDAKGGMIEPFIKITSLKNGWSINRQNAEKILEEMKMRYRHDFFHAPVLNDTRQIYLYNISVNILFYRAGIDHLFSLTEEEIKEIYRKHKAQNNLVVFPALLEDEQTGVFKFLNLMKSYRRYESWEWEKSANKALIKAFMYAEKTLNLEGMCQLMGGKENLFMQANVDGFREGDEDGDRPFVSNSLGEYGSSKVLGPVVQMQKQLNMLEGEFFIYWMMTRLI